MQNEDQVVATLPALSIQVNGSITLVDNLQLFGEKLNAYIEGINKNPSDDDDFARAEDAIKTLEKAQTALEAAESNALAQTATIQEMQATVSAYVVQARNTRLMLEKLVKARKDAIRLEIVQHATANLTEHVAGLNLRLGKPYMPTIRADFQGVIKGKKTVASLREAVNAELDRAKLEANAVADRIQINLTTLRDLAKDHAFLFADTAQIVMKANDDLTALVKSRIADHQQAEAKRLDAERERIRKEEAAKLEQQQGAANTAPAVAEAPKIEAAPRATTTAPANLTQRRPSDDAIVAVVAAAYRVSEGTAIEWLVSLDIDALIVKQEVAA